MRGLRRAVPAVAGLAATVGVVTGCGASHSSTTPTTAAATSPTSTATTAASSTTTSTPAPRTTTTTVWKPTTPEPSPDAAAYRLIETWAAGDRGSARSVATPAAVDTLFRYRFPPGALQARGCTDPTVSPGTCTYRDTRTDSLYQFNVVHGRAGWYVQSVVPET